MKSPKRAIVYQGTTIIYFNLSFTIIITTHCLFLAILPTVSQPPLPPRKRPTRMCEFIKPKKLAFEKEISKSSKPQIKPLLSKEIEQLENLMFDIMKIEFSKPYVSPVKIKTENQNAKDVHTKLTFEMPKNGSWDVERKSLYKVLLKRLLKVWTNRAFIF